MYFCRLQCSTFLQGRPGWNPFDNTEEDDVVEDRDEEDGTTYIVLKHVDLPPKSTMCDHQKAGNLQCQCGEASLPAGYNFQIKNDKNRKKNR